MNIGIDASFLRKPSTGIGQVTASCLRSFLSDDTFLKKHRLFLYTEDGVSLPVGGGVTVCPMLPFWKRDDSLRRLLWESVTIPKRVEKDSIDVFLSLSQSAARFPASVRHIMLVHDIIPAIFPEYRRGFVRSCHWKRVEKGIQSATRILAVSEWTRQDLVKQLGINTDRITVAHPGLAPQFLVGETESDTRRVLEKYALTEGYWYHGGGLEIRKNTSLVLETYRRLRAMRLEVNQPCPPLVVSGKIHRRDNPLATDVRGMMAQLGLESSVHLLDRVPDEDLPALYRGALAFLYPSRYEGFGLPVLEALSQGTPVIASNRASLPEVLGDSALLVDPDDAVGFLQHMTRILDDASLRQTLREKGKARARQFSAEDIPNQLRRLLEDSEN